MAVPPRDCRRQNGVQCTLKFSSGQRGLRFKTADLTERVNACVGTSGAVQVNLFLRDAAQNLDDFALHRRFIFLNLPAVEVRTVVGNRKF